MTTPLLNHEGMLEGLDVLYRSIHDTKIIAYLATNNCSGNTLGLKQLSAEYMGNYGLLEEDASILNKDINDVLEYNLKDCLATYWVFNKYYPLMIQDKQLDVYNNIFIPSLRVITHMELVGMPIDIDKVSEAETTLQALADKHRKVITKSEIISDYGWKLRVNAMATANAKYKLKVKSIDEFDTEFNPNSGPQLQGLLYEHLGFEVTDTTDTGAPSTGKKVLQKLLTQVMIKNNLTEEDLV